MTAYNRGQILYRVAELMEGRREQFRGRAGATPARPTPTAGSTPRSIGGSGTRGGATRCIRSLGTTNPVAGPYFNFTIPEPTGVVGRRRSAGPVAAGAGLAAGAGDRLRATPSWRSRARRAPLPAVSLAEVLATSDVPGGVVNVLTGRSRSWSRGSPVTWT